MTSGGDAIDEGERARAAAQDAELLAAVRRGEEDAMTRFYVRFTPILHRAAAQIGVDAGDRSALVSDTLATVLLALRKPAAVVPRTLMAYAIGALRHAHLKATRERQREEQLERELHREQLAQPSHADEESDAVDDTGRAPTRYARVLRLLSIEIRDLTTAEERDILAWLADYVPQREIARWLGTTHGAMRVRVHRLRERLRRDAQRFGTTLEPAERRELDRFLRRAGVTPPSTQTRRAPRGRSATDAETP